MVKNWSYRLALPNLILVGLMSCAIPTDAPTVSREELASRMEEPVQLWPDGNPGGWTAEGSEKRVMGDDQVLRVSQVESPTLTYFAPPEEAPKSSTAVVICPGGGYRILAMNKEGSDVARYLADHGYHAFVLKYRLPNKGDVRHGPALEDAHRAIEMVRSRREELGIENVGIMGFSAGGHLAAATRTSDFIALIYPAYFFRNKQAQQLAPEIAPGSNPPPAFLVHALNDRIPARNSIVYAEALAALKVPAEVHLYARGGHGYGMTLTNRLPVGDWPQHLLHWVSRQGKKSKESVSD